MVSLSSLSLVATDEEPSCESKKEELKGFENDHLEFPICTGEHATEILCQPGCCDLNEIRGNESLYCFKASGSVLGCED